jgi:hypothetical protein
MGHINNYRPKKLDQWKPKQEKKVIVDRCAVPGCGRHTTVKVRRIDQALKSDDPNNRRSGEVLIPVCSIHENDI